MAKVLAAFHILAPSNTLQHITEDSECIAAETYDPKPNNSYKSCHVDFRKFHNLPPERHRQENGSFDFDDVYLSFFIFYTSVVYSNRVVIHFRRKSTLKRQVLFLYIEISAPLNKNRQVARAVHDFRKQYQVDGWWFCVMQ